MSLDTVKLSNYTGQIEGDNLRDYLLSVDKDLSNLSKAASVFYQFGTGNNYSVLTYTSTNYVWFPTVGAWNITSTLLYGGSGSTYIGLRPGTGIWLGDESFASAPFSVDPTGVLKAHSGDVGGWSIGATILSSANLTFDSANERLESQDFVSGVTGQGWRIGTTTAEFGDIRARGKITCASFEKETLSSVGGNLMVLDSDILASTMGTGDNSTITIVGSSTFNTGDFLRIKDGTDDEWMEITGSTSAYTYNLTRDKKGDYGVNANPGWNQGTAVVNYGVSGEGGILLTSSEGNAPYIDFFTHAGVPWTTTTVKTRIGRLDGIAGASGYGIWAGSGYLAELEVIDIISVGASGYIRSNTTGNYPYIELSQSGMQLKSSDTGGTYGTAVYGTDKYGYGASVWVMNAGFGVPWVELKVPELDGDEVASLQLYDRSGLPSGPASKSQLCSVSGVLYICTTAGTPGTWQVVGAQS
jgi:hypothetical protein